MATRGWTDLEGGLRARLRAGKTEGLPTWFYVLVYFPVALFLRIRHRNTIFIDEADMRPEDAAGLRADCEAEAAGLALDGKQQRYLQ